MEQTPWEANRFSANQEIPCIIWNPKFECRICKYPSPFSILSHNIQYLLLFHSKNCYANAPQCYVIRTLSVLLNPFHHQAPLLPSRSLWHVLPAASLAKAKQNQWILSQNIALKRYFKTFLKRLHCKKKNLFIWWSWTNQQYRSGLRLEENSFILSKDHTKHYTSSDRLYNRSSRSVVTLVGMQSLYVYLFHNL